MNFLRNFMAGRYGPDHLNTALLILAIAISLIAQLVHFSCWFICLTQFCCSSSFGCSHATSSAAVPRTIGSCVTGGLLSKKLSVSLAELKTARRINSLDAPAVKIRCAFRAGRASCRSPVQSAASGLLRKHKLEPPIVEVCLRPFSGQTFFVRSDSRTSDRHI